MADVAIDDDPGFVREVHRGPRPELAPEVLARIAPVTLAGQRIVPVPDVLSPLFPWGGLPRGLDLAVRGPGAWSLALSLWGGALGPEGWLAVVGVPDLNLVAAADLGIRLDRVLVVETPGSGQWATVVAALLEAVDIVAVAPTARVGRRDARRLIARARERESILFHLDGAKHWPEAPDLVLTTRPDPGVSTDPMGVPVWQGMGLGHGYLRSRVLAVESTGRRAHGRPRSAMVTLPDPQGRLAPAPTNPTRSTAEPAPVLVLPTR